MEGLEYYRPERGPRHGVALTPTLDDRFLAAKRSLHFQFYKGLYNPNNIEFYILSYSVKVHLQEETCFGAGMSPSRSLLDVVIKLHLWATS